MLYTIENDLLRVEVSDIGAELMSIRGADDTEYLWQGNAKYWGDRAPNLFPYIGRLTDGHYTYKGEKYSLPIHGFLPKAKMELAEQSEDSIAFTLASSAETLAQYPFDFVLTVRYKLDNDKLITEYKVENTGADKMFFGIGGHPGINLPLDSGQGFSDYYIELGKTSQQIVMSPDCFCTDEKLPCERIVDGKLPLRHDMFDNDAIILVCEDHTATLQSEMGGHGVEFDYPQMNYLGIWHWPHTDAPYVCLEPWSSLPSAKGVVEDLATKKDLLSLDAGGVYLNSWSMRFF